MTEEELFTEALRRPTGAERAAYLDGACGGDAALRRRIDELLSAHGVGSPVLDRSPADVLGELGETRDVPADPLAGLLGPTDRPGAIGRLGHYDVLAVLGRGGFGIVLRAFDIKLQRVVAVKVLDPQLAATSPPRKRFLREARAAARVKDDHVVQVYAVEEEPAPHLVMEFVDGPTLQQRLDAAGPLDPAEVARLGRQVALGLAAAHDHGLIHRDVKPANILLEGAGEPRAKLTDFGLARAADDGSLTQSGVLAGTPLYMAPEQVKGAVLDSRADLFSLGSVLYTMLAGRPPFRAATSFAVMKRVAEDAPRPLREVAADVPPGLAAVIELLMAKDPADRYATAREAADALEKCLTAPPPPAHRVRRPLLAAVALLLTVGVAVWAAAGFPVPRSGDRLAAPEQAATGPPSEPDPTPTPKVAPPSRPVPAFPPGTIVVTSPADDDTPGTLRWAVSEANTHHGPDTIVFDPVVFAKPTTITLMSGPLVFVDPVRTTITGPAAGVTISGSGKTQILTIGRHADNTFERPAAVRLIDLTIAQGYVASEEGPGKQPLAGGALCYHGSELELIGCTMRDNSAGAGGAVFSVHARVLMTNCTLARNKAAREGGAIMLYGGNAKATVINCTFTGNAAAIGGAVFYNGGSSVEVYNSLFIENGNSDVVTTDGRELAGDYNLTGDESAPGPNSLRRADARLGPLGRHGGPTETCPLLTGSPAIDAGDNQRVPEGVRTDQRGKPRIGGGRVDIGAVEAR